MGKRADTTLASPCVQAHAAWLLCRTGCVKTDTLRLDLNGRFMINVVDSVVIVHHQTSKASANRPETLTCFFFFFFFLTRFRGAARCSQPAILFLSRSTLTPRPQQTSLLFDIKAKRRRSGTSDGSSSTTMRTHLPLMAALPMAPATVEGDGQIAVCT